MVAAGAQTLIKLSDVRFRWRPSGPDVLAIDEFIVRTGERVLIKGASGSGKTTLLSLIGGIITPQQGSIHIMDTVVNTLPGTRRDSFRADNIGFIFQMFNLIPYLSLADNVTLPCRFSTARRSKALAGSPSLRQEALRLLSQLALDVSVLAERSVTELSVGQQQRVAAARALIGNPALLIADEPTSALDSNVRQSFLDLLFREVAAAGATLLFVSHDAALQPHFDRVIELSTINHARPEI